MQNFLRCMIGVVGAQLSALGCADANVHRLPPRQDVSSNDTALTRVALQGAVQSPTIRDSAGVRIIDNAARKDAPIRFALGARAVFEVGGLEKSEATEFNHRAGLLNGIRLSDGRFAVIDVNRMHYFDSRARRIRIVGRNGSGPAEFRDLTALCRTAGDTLVVVDAQNGRFAIIDENGDVIRTFPRGDTRSLGSGFCLGDGTMVVVRPISSAVSGDRHAQLMRLRLDGTTVNVIGEVILHPVSFLTQVAPHVATFRQKVFFGDGAAGQVLVFNATGSLTGIIRTNDRRLPISDTDVEERIRRSRARGPRAASIIARMRAEVPKEWPAFRRIDVDSDGKLWVQDYESPRGQDHWTAFDSGGRMIGRLGIEFPLRSTLTFEVMGFGRDEVLIRRIDADGAAYLSIFPVLPAALPAKPPPVPEHR